MALKIGALCNFSHSIINTGIEYKNGTKETYIEPTVKIKVTCIFRDLFIFKFQIALTGTSKIKTSLVVLNIPLVLSMVETLMQVPFIDLFQIRSLGTHSQVLTNVNAV